MSHYIRKTKKTENIMKTFLRRQFVETLYRPTRRRGKLFIFREEKKVSKQIKSLRIIISNVCRNEKTNKLLDIRKKVCVNKGPYFID